jgi:ubiquinone/menaquinone biosynthesis C-methylase UbiE
MLDLTRDRTSSPVCQADARRLPFARGRFDRLYTAYVLDLLPLAALPELLANFYHLLKPGGRAVLLALTEGVNLPSRALVAAWKLAYAISPLACGGCRPLQLTDVVKQAGFDPVEREVVVQLGLPSEIIVADRR